MENYKPTPIIIPENGISFDAIATKIDKASLDAITCPICENLIWDIVDCSKCGNLFCRNCIDKVINQVNDSCPICRNNPFQSTGCKALTKMFSNIKLTCPNSPCKQKIEYTDYLSHQKKCKYRKYHCCNEGCDYENTLSSKKDMKKHSEECEYEIVTCINCHHHMKRSYFNNSHDHIDCLRYKVKYYKNLYKEEKKETTKLNTKIDFLNIDIEHSKEEINRLYAWNEALSEKNTKLKEELSENVEQTQYFFKDDFLLQKRKRSHKKEN